MEFFEIGGLSFLCERTKTEVLEERRKKYPDTCGQSLHFKARFLLRKLKRNETNLEALVGYLSVVVQSNTVNKDSDEGEIESVCINGVSVLSGLNLEIMQGLSFPGNKANCPWGVRIERVSVKRCLTVVVFESYFKVSWPPPLHLVPSVSSSWMAEFVSFLAYFCETVNKHRWGSAGKCNC